MRLAVTERVRHRMEETTVDNVAYAPLACRWHLHHHWLWVSTEGCHQRCMGCGKDRVEAIRGSSDMELGGFAGWWRSWPTLASEGRCTPDHRRNEPRWRRGQQTRPRRRAGRVLMLL